ncbi:TcpD family membrane protein [Listeria aquatica]|uniref:TcpD family membrane protein n=1 Tax=Listeria aquatica TaxID=1494960 RepID=UPI003F70C232
MNHFHLLLGALPTLSGLKSYIQTEGGNGATIILVFFAVVFLFKQQIGKFLGFLIFAGITFFAIGNPTAIISAIKAIWDKVV